ncbi:MAG: (2Fe-2S)-binding protein [Elsteraceae bacterium]
MYVCVCRAISDRQVAAAARQGVHTVGELFRHHGCRPQCGSCVEALKRLLSDRARGEGGDD